MFITRRSQITGTENTIDLNITLDQIIRFNSGALIQDAFPQLTPSEREFYLTGITEAEWQQYMVAPEDEEEDID